MRDISTERSITNQGILIIPYNETRSIILSKLPISLTVSYN